MAEQTIEQSGGQAIEEQSEVIRPVIEVPIFGSIIGRATLTLAWSTQKAFEVIFNVEQGTAGDFEGGRKRIAAPTKKTGTFACNFYGREFGETTVSFSAKLEDRVFAKLEFVIHTIAGSGGIWIDRENLITLPDETSEFLPAEPPLQPTDGTSLLSRQIPGNMGMNTKNAQVSVPIRKVRLAQNCTFREDNAFVKRNGFSKINNSVPVN